MKTVLSLLLLLAPAISLAAPINIGTCYKTDILTKVVSVCDGKIAGQSVYVLNLIDGNIDVYSAGKRILIGRDPIFGTTKYYQNVQRIGTMKNGELISSVSPGQTEKFVSGYKTGTQEFVYMQGSRDVDFDIDLRHKN